MRPLLQLLLLVLGMIVTCAPVLCYAQPGWGNLYSACVGSTADDGAKLCDPAKGQFLVTFDHETFATKCSQRSEPATVRTSVCSMAPYYMLNEVLSGIQPKPAQWRLDVEMDSWPGVTFAFSNSNPFAYDINLTAVQNVISARNSSIELSVRRVANLVCGIEARGLGRVDVSKQLATSADTTLCLSSVDFRGSTMRWIDEENGGAGHNVSTSVGDSDAAGEGCFEFAMHRFGFASLRHLDLSSSNVCGCLDGTAAASSRFLYFNLSHNNLTGTVLLSLLPLTGREPMVLDIRNNSFRLFIYTSSLPPITDSDRSGGNVLADLSVPVLASLFDPSQVTTDSVDGWQWNVGAFMDNKSVMYTYNKVGQVIFPDATLKTAVNATAFFASIQKGANVIKLSLETPDSACSFNTQRRTLSYVQGGGFVLQSEMWPMTMSDCLPPGFLFAMWHPTFNDGNRDLPQGLTLVCSLPPGAVLPPLHEHSQDDNRNVTLVHANSLGPATLLYFIEGSTMLESVTAASADGKSEKTLSALSHASTERVYFMQHVGEEQEAALVSAQLGHVEEREVCVIRGLGLTWEVVDAATNDRKGVVAFNPHRIIRSIARCLPQVCADMLRSNSSFPFCDSQQHGGTFDYTDFSHPFFYRIREVTGEVFFGASVSSFGTEPATTRTAAVSLTFRFQLHVENVFPLETWCAVANTTYCSIAFGNTSINLKCWEYDAIWRYSGDAQLASANEKPQRTCEFTSVFPVKPGTVTLFGRMEDMFEALAPCLPSSDGFGAFDWSEGGVAAIMPTNTARNLLFVDHHGVTLRFEGPYCAAAVASVGKETSYCALVDYANAIFIVNIDNGFVNVTLNRKSDYANFLTACATLHPNPLWYLPDSTTTTIPNTLNFINAWAACLPFRSVSGTLGLGSYVKIVPSANADSIAFFSGEHRSPVFAVSPKSCTAEQQLFPPSTFCPARNILRQSNISEIGSKVMKVGDDGGAATATQINEEPQGCVDNLCAPYRSVQTIPTQDATYWNNRNVPRGKCFSIQSLLIRTDMFGNHAAAVTMEATEVDNDGNGFNAAERAVQRCFPQCYTVYQNCRIWAGLLVDAAVCAMENGIPLRLVRIERVCPRILTAIGNGGPMESGCFVPLESNPAHYFFPGAYRHNEAHTPPLHVGTHDVEGWLALRSALQLFRHNTSSTSASYTSPTVAARCGLDGRAALFLCPPPATAVGSSSSSSGDKEDPYLHSNINSESDNATSLLQGYYLELLSSVSSTTSSSSNKRNGIHNERHRRAVVEEAEVGEQEHIPGRNVLASVTLDERRHPAEEEVRRDKGHLEENEPSLRRQDVVSDVLVRGHDVAGAQRFAVAQVHHGAVERRQRREGDGASAAVDARRKVGAIVCVVFDE